jgi:hypothetical protein
MHEWSGLGIGGDVTSQSDAPGIKAFIVVLLRGSIARLPLFERQSPAYESRRPRRSPAIVVDRFKSNAMQWLALARMRVRRNCDCGVSVPEIEAASRSNVNMSISSAADIGTHFASTTKFHVRKAANPSSGRDQRA